MTTQSVRFLVACLLVAWLGFGCTDEAGSPGDAAPVEPSMPAHEGPPFTFEVTTDGPGTLFEWSVTVPTGGWEIKFDGAQTNPRTNRAAIMIRLLQPGADDVVTQAVQKLEGQYRHARMTARTAELLVRVVSRDAPEGGEYRSAAVWSAGD